jgi:exo-beta-1,3-glucanase (GH17 family)/cellulose synthase/poly-beta-1,6-N-acetylglucosamine synthase-like glycosyltransferase
MKRDAMVGLSMPKIGGAQTSQIGQIGQVGQTKLAAQPSALRRLCVALSIAALVLLLNALVWRAVNPPIPAPDVSSQLAGLTYNAFGRWGSPLTRAFPTDAQVRADLAHIAPLTRRLRTYSASELPKLPAFMQDAGMRLSAGVWLDARKDWNEQEMRAVIQAAAQHPNIERVIAGNETLLHHKLFQSELVGYLDRLRAELKVPVSTAEPWHIWLIRPELAEHVDFITVHLLPFWEGVDVQGAVAEALRRYREVQARFPHKPVVIGEIGWPSGGDAVGKAQAAPDLQAQFIRRFLDETRDMGLDYYLIEAIDQPWKISTEGAVGAHWGVLDAQRQAKFAFTGPLQADPYWPQKALIATVLGAMALLPFLLSFAHMRLIAQLWFAVTVQAVVSFGVMLFTLPLVHYLRGLDAAVMALLVPALLLMGAILLAQAFEFAEMFWPGSLRRVLPARAWPQDEPRPLVSLHLACCNEPPEMVIATLRSLLALNWPRLQIVVVDNNTRDPDLWQPVQAFVQTWQASAAQHIDLQFFHLPHWPGFKAGALNFALTKTDPQALWVGVVDADYVVEPAWLERCSGYFAQADVAVVQAPQAHRDWQQRPLARMMNWEFDGFFRIGMHHRHERNALVQHGTMSLMRTRALREVGNWNTDCVCEDTELGLRLLEAGHRVVYVDEVMGRGLVPQDFNAYQRQRQRWAQGAMQICKRHLRALLGPSSLSLGQRYHFLAGWLPWLGDTLHLFFSFAAVLWTAGVVLAPQHVSLPTAWLVLPLLVFFAARLVWIPLLYARRVPCSLADNLGAALAGIALSHSIARGVLVGLLGKRPVFEVTAKASQTDKPPSGGHAFLKGTLEQTLLLLALLTSLLALAASPVAMGWSLCGWMLVLTLQALPYVAALVCAGLSEFKVPQGQPAP